MSHGPRRVKKGRGRHIGRERLPTVRRLLASEYVMETLDEAKRSRQRARKHIDNQETPGPNPSTPDQDKWEVEQADKKIQEVRDILKPAPYYVTMRDTFMSGHGRAQDRKAIYVYPAESIEEARLIAENAANRTDQDDIEIHDRRPNYNEDLYRVQYTTKAEAPLWYKKGGFKRKSEKELQEDEKRWEKLVHGIAKVDPAMKKALERFGA